MAIPVYPEGLPCPLRENYGFTPTNNIRRTPMDSGRARQRIEFPNAPTIVSLQWIMNQPQAMLFEAWAAQIVGAGWFTMTVLSPLGFEDLEVRFTEVPVGGQLTGKFLWRYRIDCELRNRPLLAPGWAEILPDYVLNADIFDYAVNRELPLSLWQIYIEAFDTAINEDWPEFIFDFPTYATALAAITTLANRQLINIQNDETQGGQPTQRRVIRADDPSLTLDFIGQSYASGQLTDYLELVAIYAS